VVGAGGTLSQKDMLSGGSVEMPRVVPRRVKEITLRCSLRSMGKTLMFWPLLIVFGGAVFQSTPA
jgi:hypothetical protein